EILNKAGAGSLGRDIRAALQAVPFGWPKDAIDAGLILLHLTGQLKVTANGSPVAPRSLDQGKISVVNFAREGVPPPGGSQKLAIRKLSGMLLGRSINAEEQETAPREAVNALFGLASRAGGEAPFPATPDTAWLETLRATTGNQFLHDFLAAKDKLEA